MEWKNQKITDIVSFFEDGNWIESKDQSPKGFWLVQTGNIGVITFRDKEVKRFVSEETFKRLKCTEIFTGDILISRLPDPVGRSCIVPKTSHRMLTAVDCAILRLKPNYDNRYINYLINTGRSKSQVYQLVTGSSRKRISRKNLGTIELPIPFKDGKPDLAEQKRIADKLDKVFTEIEKGQARVLSSGKEATKFRHSLMSKFLSNPEWQSVKLGDKKYFHIETGSTPRTSVSEYWNGEIIWITPKDLGANKKKEISKSDRRITQKGLNNSSATLVPMGSIIISTRAPIGYVALAATELCFNQGCKAVVLKSSDISVNYLYYAVLSVVVDMKTLGKGSVFDEISKSKLESIQILLPFKNGKPDLKEQERIADELDKTFMSSEQLEKLFEKQKESFTVLRSSVLNQSFQMQT